MKFSRRSLSFLTACMALAIGGVVCGMAPAVADSAAAAAPSAPVAQSRKRPFTSQDVFNQSMSYASNAAQWANIQKLLDKPAPKLEVDNFTQMSSDFKAKPMNSYRNQIIVLDFWATWCGPCKAGMPKNSELAKKLSDKGVVFLGVCNSNGGSTMVETGKKSGMLFPTALDSQDKAKNAFGVQWYPYYVVIDRDGVVRAAGASPSHIEAIVNKILEYQPASAATTRPESGSARSNEPVVRPEWLEGGENRRRQIASLENQPAPSWTVEQWLNTEEPMSVEGLKGNLVLVVTWATWCGNCKAAVPTINELQNKYSGRGLVVIGVCAQRGHEKMAETVKTLGIRYPVAADTSGKTIQDYRVDGYPDYYLIGRDGSMLAADIKNGNIEDVIISVLESEKR